jgi:hypothetical protein
MRVPVRSNLVTTRADLLDKAGITLGDPSQHEKRPPHITTVEHVEELMRIADYTARQAIPIFAAERAADAADVKPLLDVDGQAVAGHRLPAG